MGFSKRFRDTRVSPVFFRKDSWILAMLLCLLLIEFLRVALRAGILVSENIVRPLTVASRSKEIVRQQGNHGTHLQEINGTLLVGEPLRAEKADLSISFHDQRELADTGVTYPLTTASRDISHRNINDFESHLLRNRGNSKGIENVLPTSARKTKFGHIVSQTSKTAAVRADISNSSRSKRYRFGKLSIRRWRRKLKRRLQRKRRQRIAKSSDDLTRLSLMLYKIIKEHNVTSVLHVPCRSSVHWVLQLVRRLEYEIPGIKYFCVVDNEREYHRRKKISGNDTALEFLIRHEFWNCPLPKVDLAFPWQAIGYIEPEKSWQLLRRLQAAQVKHVAVPNYPLVRSNTGASNRNGRANVRRSPYLFGEPLRIVRKINRHSQPKQLLLYNLQDIRK